MDKPEKNPGDINPEGEGLSEEQLAEKTLGIIAAGGSVRVILNGAGQTETIREFVDTMREAGAEVIFPSDN